MIKHPNQRVGVFIDVQNMYYSARTSTTARSISARSSTRPWPDAADPAIAYVVKARGRKNLL